MVSKSMINRVLLRYAGRSKSKYLAPPQEMLQELRRHPLLVFDTETTGLFAKVHQITEIAAEVLRAPEFEVLDSFHRKIALTDKTKARVECETQRTQKDEKFFGVKKCLELQGYNPDDPGLYEEDKALLEFADFCDKHNAVIVGQNAGFDMQMVNTRLKSIDPGRSIRNQGVYDTKIFFSTFVLPALIAMRKRGDDSVKPMLDALTVEYTDRKTGEKKTRLTSSLGPMLKSFGIDIKGWHGAAADVKSTVEALKRIGDFMEQHADIYDDPTFKEEQSRRFRRELDYVSKGKEQRNKFYREERKLGL